MVRFLCWIECHCSTSFRLTLLTSMCMLCILWSLAATFYKSPISMALFAAFTIHYSNRVLIYPWRIRGGKPTPISIMASAFFFCIWNGYIQGYYLTQIAPEQQRNSASFFIQCRRVIGLLLWFIGFCINIHSDGILMNLRKEGEV